MLRDNYNMKDIKSYAERIEFIRNELIELGKLYEYGVQQTEEMEDATQDILHTIELSSYEAGRKYYNKLRQIRKKRREAKDTVTLLLPMYNLLNYYESNGIKIATKSKNSCLFSFCNFTP